MGWILEPGQSTILHTLSAEGTIREVSGLPTGVSTRPALPVDLAAGAELALVASQTPALGTFTIGFTVVYARPSGDPGDPDRVSCPRGTGTRRQVPAGTAGSPGGTMMLIGAEFVGVSSRSRS